jgi:hypothetical protein
MASPTIENYLRALRQELRMPRRMERRILREIRMHLIDASAEIGEPRAVEALGPPALVAARFAAEEPPRPTRRIRRFVLAAGAIVVTAIAALFVWVSGRDGGMPPPYVHLALQREQAGEYTRARHWITLAVERNSGNWRLWLIRTRIETEVGDIDAARRSLSHVRMLNPPAKLTDVSASVTVAPVQFGPPLTASRRGRQLGKPVPTRQALLAVGTPSGGIRVHWTWVKLSPTCSVPAGASIPVQTEPMPRGTGCARFGFPSTGAKVVRGAPTSQAD